MVLHDKEDNTYSQSSTIKVFHIADELDFKGSFDSTIFGVPTIEPMNSMSIEGKHLLVTVGGKGLGYANLDNLDTSPQFIDLSSQADISGYTFENTQFARISIHSLVVGTGEMTVFLTTSNSIHYMISMKVQPGGIVYGGVK